MMQYLLFVPSDDDPESATLYTAPVASGDDAYLRQVTQQLQPLSDEQYLSGPAVVLQTVAKYSYILHDKAIFWCIEWEPGLIVVRFTPDGLLAWTALRSPVPNFGGREADESAWDSYDEDAENPQYNLIFDPWDALFDTELRDERGFVPADTEIQAQFDAALAHANDLSKAAYERLTQGSLAERTTWSEHCKANLKTWSDEGR
ncbi:hypothetical protein [Armatimonas sp.]|uniref:hypothetical protein n=1 Tax=Armatimonas sp. TaxID=1872638 RepID=UPI00286AABCF|nr:hypothetical protein [Armatimonas sp.]